MEKLVCRDCGAGKDATEFRLRQAGGVTRIRQCRTCHCHAEKLRREAKRSRQHRQAVNRQLARLKQAKSARQVGAVCDQLIGCFGGLDGFTAAWRACLEADLARGGFAALRHLEATIRLIQFCEQARPRYSGMTEDELQSLVNARL